MTLGVWVGWYGNEGASATQPDAIRWTEGASGDCYRECVTRLEEAAPPGRILVVLLRGARPGPERSAHDGASRNRQGGAPAVWAGRIAEALQAGQGRWLTATEMIQVLGVKRSGTLLAWLNRMVEDGTLQQRQREGATWATREYRRAEE